MLFFKYKDMIEKKVKEQVVSLYNNGTTIKRIMEVTGVKSEQTIYRILRDNGVKKRGVKKNRVIKITLEEELLDKFENKTDEYIIAQINKHLSGI